MLQKQLDIFFPDQFRHWEAIRINYQKLKRVKSRTCQCAGYLLRITCNPERMRSTAARVDIPPSGTGNCFLCESNRPAEQLSLNFADTYSVLVNPYPIFPHHLTIPDKRHVPQSMNEQRLNDMLTLASELPDYTVFYNGPSCGASAPDHFHFQAGDRNFMPLEENCRKKAVLLYRSDRLEIKTLNDYPCPFLLAVSQEKNSLLSYFQRVSELMQQIITQLPEPMMNIHTFYENGTWSLCIFPRRKRRPDQFFEEGNRKILFSPGAVDTAGVLILPREEDYRKISGRDIRNMLAQVSYTPEQFESLKRNLQHLNL